MECRFIREEDSDINTVKGIIETNEKLTKKEDNESSNTKKETPNSQRNIGKMCTAPSIRNSTANSFTKSVTSTSSNKYTQLNGSSWKRKNNLTSERALLLEQHDKRRRIIL